MKPPNVRASSWMVRSALVGALGAASLTLIPSQGRARSIDDCQSAWSKAVRSYLTKNRKAAPDGSVPKDMDALEAASQQWLTAFRPACELEAAGDKPGARVEAAALGVKILAKLDLRGCSRFLEYYMQSTRSQEICRTAVAADDGDLRQQIESSIPER